MKDKSFASSLINLFPATKLLPDIFTLSSEADKVSDVCFMQKLRDAVKKNRKIWGGGHF